MHNHFIELGDTSLVNGLIWFQVKDVSLDRLSAIASHPKAQNAFKIQNYHGLTGILENFQNRIFKMEGDVWLFIYLFVK